ncbi:MAG: VCBS repeat-containing protein, partial [Thermoguttaceae bacterium]|nr:VCBS repeat-containing protein [Thermoguttaceae bacterium]
MTPSSHPWRPWTMVVWAGALVIAAAFSALLWWAVVPASTPGPYTELLHAATTEEPLDEETVAQIREFCGDCHAVPSPESFHRNAWTEEVAMGYDFYARSGRTDLVAPPMDRTVAYFRARAPEHITYPTPPEATKPFAATFAVERLSPGGPSRLLPAIADLRWCRLRAEGQPVLVACDMNGAVVALDVLQRRQGVETLAMLRNPCHVEPCDLDADGLVDLVVADLGSFQAADHDRGRVVWLRQNRAGHFDEVVVAAGLGRVDDVRPADFDADGDTDLLVADFGFHRTGK